MPICSACGTENPDVARFCLACGSPLTPEAPPAEPAEERKVITVVFTDLVGSTARSEQLDPEDVKAMVAPYHARVRAELERHGGTFEKFSGDAVMALFGAPIAHEDDPERAVLAGIAIRDAIHELNESDQWLDLHIRVGVHTGEALVTLDARPSEGEWMAAGDVMNTAARLQSAAPIDGILVGEHTYRATKYLIEYRETEPVAAKGKTEPVTAWEAVAVTDSASRGPAVDVPLVGRADELETLFAFCSGARRRGGPAVATVLGPPGIGKSRLLGELTHRLGEEVDVHWGSCLSYGEGATYWPITEVLKAAAGILIDDEREVISAKLGVLLEGLDTEKLDELRTMAAALSNLVGVPTTPRGTHSAVEISQAELHWGIRRLLELLAAKRPTVLVLEDLHWAEPTLLELMQFIVESSSAAPLLVLASARPEAKETPSPIFTPGENTHVLELEALSEDESASLVEELARGLPAETRDALLRNAGGNPLFLEETVRMLQEAPPTDGGARELSVPTSLQALIASRIDQLPSAGKRVAQHASVIGHVFWVGAVAHLVGDNGDLSPELTNLEQRDLVRAQTASSLANEREYAFKHILIRDVAYGQLPKRRRSMLHHRCADWVAALPGGDDDVVEITAYHLEQACLLAASVARPTEPPPVEMAVAALVRAAKKAERREGIREARRFYERALALVPDARSERAIELRLRRARTLAALGELRLAHEELIEIVDAAPTVDRSDLRCAALVALGNVDQKQGQITDARARLSEAQVLAAETGDRRLQVRADYELAALKADFDGAIEDAVDDLRSGLTIADEIENRGLKIEGHMRLATLLFNSGALEESEEQLIRCSALAAELGSQRDEARAIVLLGMVTFYRGDEAAAQRLGRQADEWLERTSESYFQIQNMEALAKYALARDEPEEAEEWLRRAIPLALDGAGWLVVDIYRLLAETLLRQGRLEDARLLVRFAARNLPEEDLFARASLLLATASVAAADDEPHAATAQFEEAIRLLEEQHLSIELGEARLAFGQALLAFGEETAARVELERARALFKRMGAQRLLSQVSDELQAIA